MPTKTILQRFEEKYVPEPNSGCWLWIGSCRPNGYGSFWFREESMPAHRASYILFVGELGPGVFACHSCDVRPCVNPDHLWPGTNSDNMLDTQRKNGTGLGERNSQSLLTAADVQLIRSSALSAALLSEQLGVSQATVFDVRSGRRWSHV